MEIQDESLVPVSPLDDLDVDYIHAVLHLAWDWHKRTDEVTLLFGFVELLPAEIPPPIDDYSYKDPRCSLRLGNDSAHHVYVRHAVISARAGLDWYAACRAGVAILPDDDGAIRAPDDARENRLKLADLGEEPPWPTLISASDDSDRLPFVPQWVHCPRTHHLLPLTDFARDALWSQDELQSALGWLRGRLHFAFEEYPEYLGSVHLVAPNPLYRAMRTRLQRRAPPAESVLIRFRPRTGKSVHGLNLTYRERDAYGVTASRAVTVRSPVMRVNHPREVHAISADVLDPRRGFLQVSNQQSVFIRQISLNVGLMHHVNVQGPKSSYEVARTGKPERSVGGEPKVATARGRMLGGYYARRTREEAAAQDQRWFRGQQPEAREMLRSLLHGASESVFLIDPYFGPDELGEFPLAVGRYDVPIRILGSTKGLKEKCTKDGDMEKGDALVGMLGRLRAEQQMNPFEIRVMRGKDPEIHDRFIVVDKRIWLLGSSLHDFGSRGTMMLGLPNPDPVRATLLAAWHGSEALEEWVQRRRVERDGEQRLGP